MTGQGSVGRVGRLKCARNIQPVMNQRVGKFIADNVFLHNDFLYYVISSEIYESLFFSMASGSGQPNLSPEAILSVGIPTPPYQAQVKIAGVFNALDDRISLLRETNTTLEAIAQALFKSWFVDFDPVRAKAEGLEPEGLDAATAALFPDSFEDSELGLVPKGWKVANIGIIANVIDCLHAKKPALKDVGRPFLQLNNIRDDGLLDVSRLACISSEDYKKWVSRIEVEGGDCVITNVGRVGAVSQIPSGFKAAMGRNMTAVRLRPEWKYPTYLIELLQSTWIRTEINTNTDVGTILNALNVKNIPKLRCVTAPPEVMQAFETSTRPLRNAMEMNMVRMQNLTELRDTLLPRLISGQLRLPEAEVIVEEVSA
jgi:type I restriction enzyme S subunit